MHPHSYPWHDGHTDHYRALAKAGEIVNDQNAPAKTSKDYGTYAQDYGHITPAPTNLKFYPMTGKANEVNSLVAGHGFIPYYAGGKHGKPDLANKNYNTKHLMIYDPTPQSGGDFGEHEYTDNWRKTHELAHALTYPQINSVYGEGRRIGGLGTRSSEEAKRAVHWEWLAAHKQRDLNRKIGIHISDEDFNKELNTVMHDAVHRAITGKFSDPSGEGFYPHSHKVPLDTALRHIDEAAKQRQAILKSVDKFEFIEAIIGADGASALKKAGELHPALESAILPRCAVSWVKTCVEGYEGEIPGLVGSVISFKKSEKGFEGTITFQDQSYSFKEVSEYHVAACIVTALGTTEESVSDARSVEIARLGKSIDLLIKSHAINEEAEQRAINKLKLIRDAAKGVTAKLRKKDKDSGGTGTAAKPQAPTPPSAPTGAQPATAKPAMAGTPQAPKGTSSKPKATTMKLSEKDMTQSCVDCGLRLFKNECFVGCVCFRDLAKRVTTKRVGIEFFIDLSKLDLEEASVVRESIKNG